MYHLVLLGKENNLYVLDGDKDSIEMMFELTGMSKSAEKTYRAIWMADATVTVSVKDKSEEV